MTKWLRRCVVILLLLQLASDLRVVHSPFNSDTLLSFVQRKAQQVIAPNEWVDSPVLDKRNDLQEAFSEDMMVIPTVDDFQALWDSAN